VSIPLSASGSNRLWRDRRAGARRRSRCRQAAFAGSAKFGELIVQAAAGSLKSLARNRRQIAGDRSESAIQLRDEYLNVKEVWIKTASDSRTQL